MILRDVRWHCSKPADLKQILKKLKGFLNKITTLDEPTAVRYLAVPLWKPWRDY